MLTRIGFLSFTILLFSQLSIARDHRNCKIVFSKISLETLLRQYRKPEELRASVVGQWIKIRNTWVRYEIFGVSGPVHVALEGLGGQIETSLNSAVNRLRSETERVLVIELEGQGAREVNRRLELIRAFSEDTRFIDYNNNVDTAIQAVRAIGQIENFTLGDVATWSGHSFGGMTVSSILTRATDLQSPLVQFFATGVANFNHRLVDDITNSAYIYSSELMKHIPGAEKMAIQGSARFFADDVFFEGLKDDAIKLEAVTGLTLGASAIDTVTHPTQYPAGSRVQIFSAQLDRVVFPMQHWELATSAKQAGHPTALVMVEGADHYLPQKMNAAQLEAVNQMTTNPHRYDGYYFLTTEGQLIRKSTAPDVEALLNEFKAQSLATWNAQSDMLHRVFKSVGKTPVYPKSWQ